MKKNLFDLNIDHFLGSWTVEDALREIIANAIDESRITGTPKPYIEEFTKNGWKICDQGRGLKVKHFLQKESEEKRENPYTIGKFGVGLKDSIAVLCQKEAKVLIRTQSNNFSFVKAPKNGFEDLWTLHVEVKPPDHPEMNGTRFYISGISEQSILRAQEAFLCYRNLKTLESTNSGEVYEASSSGGEIFINGMRVACEPEFLFSYNITSLDSKIKKELTRERKNLGRGAYSSRVQSILSLCKSDCILERLAKSFDEFSSMPAQSELVWTTVQTLAVAKLNATEPVLFIPKSSNQQGIFLKHEASRMGMKIVPISDNLQKTITNEMILDVNGNAIRDMDTFALQRSESLETEWISEEDLNETEKGNWLHRDQIIELFGGLPPAVSEIRISGVLRANLGKGSAYRGLWQENHGRIIIHRSTLSSLEEFSSVLMHEMVHAQTGEIDLTIDFELSLTNLIGKLAEKLLS